MKIEMKTNIQRFKKDGCQHKNNQTRKPRGNG